MTTRGQRFLSALQDGDPGHAAVVADDAGWSYRDLLQPSPRMVTLLREHGVQRGSTVAFFDGESGWPGSP